jgi:exopolyphosphatase/guanosine-5'-triphosphate,3'-diphosphate pyrophosphatase
VSSPVAQRERLAAIDVGSNSIRLLVAEWDPATGLEVIDELKEQPRLATGLHANGELDPDAMEAAFNALRRMIGVTQRRGVSRVVAVATSAIRDASNGPAFAERVRRELGLELEVISEEREARLSWVSVAHHFRLDNTRAMIADIGGGSLELVAAVDGLVEATSSLPLGAVRLTEAHLNEEDPWAAVGAMRKAARRHLKKAMPWRDWRQATVIGSGGTFTNMARIAAARRGLATDPIHGTTVTTGEVEALLEWLSTMTAAERARVPGLNPQRADIILAGMAVTAELMSLLDARELTVSAFGLREGLLLDMVGAESAPSRASDPLRLLREFVDRCRGDRRHVEQVRLLALTLYDALADELGCNAEERWLLEAAALLHDTGQLVSYARHHKHSYQLIMHADRLGIGLRERTLVALISRYHRKKGPSRKHEEFAALEADDQQVVRRLSGLLRVADGLDRGHTAAVDRLTVTLLDDRCIIRAYPRLQGADLSLEVWGAERKQDVLEKGLRRDVVVAAGM